jgi:hypothetical protein
MSDFSWKIWAKKWLFGAGAVLGSTALIYTADYMKATEFPVEYQFWAGLLILVFIQVGNMIKHSYPSA